MLKRVQSTPLKENGPVSRTSSLPEADGLRVSVTSAHPLEHKRSASLQVPHTVAGPITAAPAPAPAPALSPLPEDTQSDDDRLAALAHNIVARRSSTISRGPHGASSRFTDVHPHLRTELPQHTEIRLQLFRNLLRQKVNRKRNEKTPSPVATENAASAASLPALTTAGPAVVVAHPLSPIAERSPTAAASGPEFHSET